jgi:hypothetical protein
MTIYRRTTLVAFVLIGLSLPGRPATLESAPAGTERLIEGVRYTYDIEPNSITDPDHTKLTDGKDTVAVWFPKPFNSVTVDFDLGSNYKVTRVEVDAHRAGTRSRLRNMQLFTNSGTGYTLVGIMQNLAGADYNLKLRSQPAAGVAPLALISKTPLTFTFDNIDRECYQLRLWHQDAYDPGPHWGLAEVRIYGAPITEQLPSTASSPEAQAAALEAYSVPDTGGQLVFREGNFDRDPEKELLLANPYVTLVIEPSLGGVIGSFSYQGVEFTQPKNPQAPGGGGGFLSDHVSSQSIDGDWFNAAYGYTVTEETRDRISVRLSATGKTDSLKYLTFNKTITIRRDRSDVQVDYDIALDEKATVPLPFAFWFHNYVGTRAATPGQAKSRRSTFYVPEDYGIRKLHWPTEKRSDAWFNNTVRGWAGLADSGQNIGLVFGFDYRHLMNVYSWGAKSNNALPTLEWRFNEISVPDGSSFKTTFTITPFHSLDRISGAAPSMVGTINYEAADKPIPSRVTATVISAAARGATAILRHRLLPVGNWQTLLTKDVTLEVDKPLSVTADFTAKSVGTHVFSLIIEKAGEELLDLEEPISIGEPKDDYVLRPKVQQPRTANTRVNVQYTSMDYETPHVKWARPYHRGKIKALVLIDGRYQREVIELAQRIDLDFDSTFLYRTEVGESLSDYYGKTTVDDLELGLARLLSENPDWQVLVMAGHMFRYFNEDQRRHVEQKIKDGAGLVVVQPDMTDPMPSLSPLLRRGDLHPRGGQWTRTKEHFITNGIPWRALPDVAEWYPYELAEAAELLASVKDDPLLAIREYGKGRVAALSYRSGDERISEDSVGIFCGLTPFMTSRRADDFIPYPTFNYYEYHFSLLARAILWAAKKEPALRVDKIEATAERVTINLDNQGGDLSATLEMAITDKYGNVLAKPSPVAMRITAGKKAVELPVPVSLGSGVNLFDVFLRNEQGKIINWASTSLTVVQPTTIKRITEEMALARAARRPGPVYRSGSTIDLEISLGGAIDPGLSLAVSTIDGFGRITVAREIPVTSDLVRTSVVVENPRSMMLTVHAELVRDEKTLDIHEIRVPVELPLPLKPHEGEPILLGWSLPSYYGLNNYLIPSYFKLLSEIGFNGILVSGHSGTTTAFESAWRNNMRLQTRGPSIYVESSSKSTKLELPVRYPTLVNPQELKAWADGVAHIRTAPNTFAIQAGDEASYGRGVDYDFSDESLTGMREWLQTEYADLDALNRQWGTAFEAWGDVAPLTLKQSRARGDHNYSAWSDHRSWGEMVVSGFYRILGDAVTNAKPGSFFGPSGNPGVGTYGGYDFWQLSKVLTGLWAYGGSDELSIWSRGRTKILKYSTFGGVNNQRVRNYGTLFTGTSGTVVCGTQRVPAFDWTDSRAGAGYRAAWIPLKAGIGRAIHEATRTPDPIAIHYSRNASRIAYALDLSSVWKDTHWQIRKLFQSSGFDHDWISYEQLENGETENLKLIFLPISFTLSDREVAALEKFVQQGGVLVGELGIGIADEHGKILSLQEPGRLDHVFGITRQDSRIALRKDKTVPEPTATGLEFPELSFNYLEFGVEAASAEILAKANENKVPIAFVNSYGKGLAVYLACDLTTSYFLANGARGIGNNAKYSAATEAFITSLCATAGATPQLGIETDSGEPVPFTRTVMFTQGEIKYFGILREHRLAKDFATDPVQVTLTFPGKGHVRELFSDTDYGFTDKAETILKPTTVLLYCWVPYRVEGIDLKLSKRNAAPGEVISYTIALNAAVPLSTHTLHLKLIDPDGELSKPYSRNITAGTGKAEGLIPLALNDKKGIWKIELKDVTSGRKTETRFEVK